MQKPFQLFSSRYNLNSGNLYNKTEYKFELRLYPYAEGGALD